LQETLPVPNIFSNKVIIWWYKLHQLTALTRRASKLAKIRHSRMGFFMDWSAEPYCLLWDKLSVRPHKVSEDKVEVLQPRRSAAGC